MQPPAATIIGLIGNQIIDSNNFIEYWLRLSNSNMDVPTPHNSAQSRPIP